jgi:hypothetical protein
MGRSLLVEEVAFSMAAIIFFSVILERCLHNIHR